MAQITAVGGPTINDHGNDENDSDQTKDDTIQAAA
jgi:hypothetical protein